MPHLYDREPPAFAKDPWAWDYTRDRMEQNNGVTYDQWEAKHFAGAASMYKNVVNKYGQSVKSGILEAPRECVDCGEMNQHYDNDFVCKDCRDKIEDSSSYYEAEETISRPDAMDDIRKMLADKLNHKPAAKKAAPAPVSVDNDNPASTVSRNFGAMSDDKLQRSIKELEAGNGDSVRKAQAKGEDVLDHLEQALRVAQERGF